MKQKEIAASTDINYIETDYKFMGEALKDDNHSKTNILFIPGIGCEYEDHRKFKDLLVSYNYYALNLPGHGRSKIPSYEQLSLQDLTNYVLDFIEARNLDSLVLIAHGTSCAIAGQLCQIIPQKIICNILVSPLDNTFVNDARQVRDILVPKTDEEIDQLYRMAFCQWDEKKHNNPAWRYYKKYKLREYTIFNKAMNVMYDYFLDENFKESLESLYMGIAMPTMIVYGQDDGLLRVNESIQNMQSLIPDVALATIPLAGYMPFVENPHNYYSNVLSFMDYYVDKYLVANQNSHMLEKSNNHQHYQR